MDRTLPFEVMLLDMEEIQISLLENPEEGCELTYILIISYALIKMVNPGLYGKSIDRWNNLPAADRKQLVEFRALFISEYERILIEKGNVPPIHKRDVVACLIPWNYIVAIQLWMSSRNIQIEQPARSLK